MEIGRNTDKLEILKNDFLQEDLGILQSETVILQERLENVRVLVLTKEQELNEAQGKLNDRELEILSAELAQKKMVLADLVTNLLAMQTAIAKKIK